MQIEQLVVTGKPESLGSTLSCSTVKAYQPLPSPTLSNVSLLQMGSGVPSPCCPCSEHMGTVWTLQSPGCPSLSTLCPPLGPQLGLAFACNKENISATLPWLLGNPKGEWGVGSGANLETKSRIWVTWSLFLVLTWPGWGGGWGQGLSPTPVSHTNKYGLGKWAEFFSRA